jgi:hypothetical protein
MSCGFENAARRLKAMLVIVDYHQLWIFPPDNALLERQQTP